MPSEPPDQMLLFGHKSDCPRRASYSEVRNAEPLSRHTDPLPSYVAANKVKRTGIGGRQRLAVYHALRANQGSTSAELARIMDVDRYQPSRRLPELAAAGWVVRGQRRRCSVTNVECTTWFVSRPWREKPAGKAGGPGSTGESRATGQPGDMPGPVLTPEERRRLRERLATAGNEQTRRFLSALGKRGAR